MENIFLNTMGVVLLIASTPKKIVNLQLVK